MQQKGALSPCSEFRLQAGGGDMAAPPAPANANASGAREQMQQKGALSLCSEFRLQAAGGDMAAPPAPANANASGARKQMRQESALPPPRPMKWGEGWGEGK